MQQPGGAALNPVGAVAHQATLPLTGSLAMVVGDAEIVGHEQTTPRPEPGEAFAFLLAVAAAGAGPDEAVALTFLVGEEVGVDRSGEARIVELEPEIVAALGGAL